MLLNDVLPPGAEPVYPGHTALCQATPGEVLSGLGLSGFPPPVCPALRRPGPSRGPGLLSPQPVPLMSGGAYLNFSNLSLGSQRPSASRLSGANDVEKVVVVILDKEHRPVEKFVFEITQPPLLSISSDSLLSHVEQLLRAFILKISVCDAVLDHNPPGCTFTVLVHTREAATRNMEKIQVIKDFPWILADEQDVHMHDPRLIPLKTMTSDILKMQLYVEERAHKSS
ncbi:PREDICTED: mitotic spindle assembly checkpoint protein MAD2B isoform X1 [Hipposideros armiger]|uniref:Mitotic spindle assembly checkpoint protein MAD2B n=1 Tax=Hipposideros armiger TaxID=186990 RepID=A0A8B7R5B2_HIPAR|nr:PREDICTED: mitotic spindle assembly checkpoint protein MAD2B isoform X1 [Hipposideros armiger]